MVLGIMGMIGQLVFSCVGDYVKGKLMLVNLIAISLVVVNNIVAAYSTTLAAVFMYSAIVGVGCGMYLAIYFPVHNEIMDGENVATLFLTMRFSRGVGATAAPYIAGYIRDVTGSYSAAFLSVASSFGVFVTATLALICINKFRNLQSLDEEKEPITGMSSR
ncbi:monocarboxylate transporter 10-like [Lingula anatina]|uniref:Monocarboxylate transporter 10-like n=1 Tax=Lingula anatina TaxID=7574 RepID=A0A1S3HYU5_LINAN|nr:monocarboxylate transporter 10-like [Lingula anatina]|eukprot:XP_013391195.1 monocarboxylate transporter 10-like [Lingula anatina]